MDIIYGTVLCHREWPIYWAVDGELAGWHSCGGCGEMPVLIELERDGEVIWRKDSSIAS